MKKRNSHNEKFLANCMNMINAGYSPEELEDIKKTIDELDDNVFNLSGMMDRQKSNTNDSYMNKYRVQVDAKRITPQYILDVFKVTNKHLRESFINIIALQNPEYIVITKYRDDVELAFDATYLPGDYIDVYDVLLQFNITHPAQQHAIKKILMAGKRGHKDVTEDLYEIISALSRF